MKLLLKIHATQITELKDSQNKTKENEMNKKLLISEERLKKSEDEKLKLIKSLEEQKGHLKKIKVELMDSKTEIEKLNEEVDEANKHYELQKNTIINLKSDINSHKAKIMRLEMDNKELQQRKSNEKETEEFWDKIEKLEEFSHNLERENEDQKIYIGKLNGQLKHINEKLIRKKSSTKRHKCKIRELKKERDLLKIEVLKVKQLYSEKCDGYKEAKNRLQKELKEKKEALASLEAIMSGNINEENIHKKSMFEWRDSHLGKIENENYLQPKSLENTYKYHFNDLSSTLQPNEMRKKIDLFTVDDQTYKKRKSGKHKNYGNYIPFNKVILQIILDKK